MQIGTKPRVAQLVIVSRRRPGRHGQSPQRMTTQDTSYFSQGGIAIRNEKETKDTDDHIKGLVVEHVQSGPIGGLKDKFGLTIVVLWLLQLLGDDPFRHLHHGGIEIGAIDGLTGDAVRESLQIRQRPDPRPAPNLQNVLCVSKIIVHHIQQIQGVWWFGKSYHVIRIMMGRLCRAAAVVVDVAAAAASAVEVDFIITTR